MHAYAREGCEMTDAISLAREVPLPNSNHPNLLFCVAMLVGGHLLRTHANENEDTRSLPVFRGCRFLLLHVDKDVPLTRGSIAYSHYEKGIDGATRHWPGAPMLRNASCGWFGNLRLPWESVALKPHCSCY